MLGRCEVRTTAVRRKLPFIRTSGHTVECYPPASGDSNRNCPGRDGCFILQNILEAAEMSSVFDPGFSTILFVRVAHVLRKETPPLDLTVPKRPAEGSRVQRMSDGLSHLNLLR